MILKYMEEHPTENADKQKIMEILALSKTKDSDNQKRIAKFLNDPDPTITNNNITALSSIGPDDEEIQMMILNSEKLGSSEKLNALAVVGNARPTSKNVQLKIASYVPGKGDYINQEALIGLGKIKPTDREVISIMIKGFDSKNDDMAATLMKHFLANPINDEEVQLKITEQFGKNGYYNTGDWAVEYFSNILPKTDKVQVELMKEIRKGLYNSEKQLIGTFKALGSVSPAAQNELIKNLQSWELYNTIELFEISPQNLTKESKEFLKMVKKKCTPDFQKRINTILKAAN